MIAGQDWMEQAACAGLNDDTFYPDLHGAAVEAHTARVAAAYCDDCPVRQSCLEWALLHENYGIWGGLAAHQRDELLQRPRRSYRR